MAVNSISSVGSSEVNQDTTQQLRQDDFIKLFMSQLKAQDPLEPVNNQDFLAQMAQFSLLESSRVTNNELSSIKSLVESTHGTGLIGKNVETTTINGDVLGEVISVGFTEIGVIVSIKAKDKDNNEFYINDLPMSQIKKIYSDNEE